MEMPSIKLYKERQKYNEWEFVYEIKSDKRLMRGGVGEAMNGDGAKARPGPVAFVDLPVFAHGIPQIEHTHRATS